MKAPNQRGAVLLLVLVVVALLSAILTDWAFSTLVDLRLTETFRDGNRAYYLARGGVEVGRQLLRIDTNGYDAPTELWGVGIPAYPVDEDASVTIRIIDEDGRFNLNQIYNSVGRNTVTTMNDRLVRLMTSLDIANSADLCEALIDWIDEDNSGSAESPWYRSLNPPREVKNAPLDTVDELLLIKGFTPEIVGKLAPFVTVATVADASGVIKINLNTAPPELLVAWDPSLSATDIEPLLLRRESKPLETMIDVRDALGGASSPTYISLNPAGNFVLTSQFYRVTAEAQIGDGKRTVEALIQKTGNKLLWRRVY